MIDVAVIALAATLIPVSVSWVVMTIREKNRTDRWNCPHHHHQSESRPW